VSLEGAREALDQGNRPGALAALLAAWKTTRAPAIADAIDVVSADVARTVEPLFLPKPKLGRLDRHRRWIDVCDAHDPVDLPRLLDELVREPITAPLIRERLERLEHVPPDPRVAAKLIDLLCDQLPWAPKPLWTNLFRLLGALRDVRGRPRLPAALAKAKPGPARAFFADFRPRIEKLIEALAADPLVLPAAEQKLLTTIVTRARAFAEGPPPAAGAARPPKAPTVSPRDEGELLALVYAKPDDDATRLVYGDWCSDRGLQRGELIALQCKPKPAKKDEAQAKKLLKAHLAEWLGPLEPVVVPRSARFERGFLAACETKFRTPKQRAELAAHPAWSTVHTVTTDEPKLVQSARALCRVHDASPKLLLQLCAGPPLAIDSLRLRLEGPLWRTPIADELRAALAKTTAFPRLVDFESSVDYPWRPIDPEGYTWLFACPLGKQLRRFAVTKNPLAADGVAVAAWLPVLPRTLEETRFDVGYFSLVLRGKSARVLVRHGAERLIASLTGVTTKQLDVSIEYDKNASDADRRSVAGALARLVR
jgi:uncharacterized protein (TIGR02996 family)